MNILVIDEDLNYVSWLVSLLKESGHTSEIIENTQCIYEPSFNLQQFDTVIANVRKSYTTDLFILNTLKDERPVPCLVHGVSLLTSTTFKRPSRRILIELSYSFVQFEQKATDKNYILKFLIWAAHRNEHFEKLSA